MDQRVHHTMMVYFSLTYFSPTNIQMYHQYVFFLGGCLDFSYYYVSLKSLTYTMFSQIQLAYYYSGGLRLNPNLYASGKVCLSLLNTWRGSGCETWVPDMSTMLQVLVSIQGLILNAKPYYNEPGYESQSGSAAGENRSRCYNEDTFILTIKTMVYSIRRPPKVQYHVIV